MRRARIFRKGEMPRCAKCQRPHFLMLGPLLVCSSRKPTSRQQCNTAHFGMTGPTGDTVLVWVPEDEVQQVKESDMVSTTLQKLGLPQVAQELLSGVRRAA